MQLLLDTNDVNFYDAKPIIINGQTKMSTTVTVYNIKTRHSYYPPINCFHKV